MFISSYSSMRSTSFLIHVDMLILVPLQHLPAIDHNTVARIVPSFLSYVSTGSYISSALSRW